MNLAKWLSVCLQTKWIWVRISLHSFTSYTNRKLRAALCKYGAIRKGCPHLGRKGLIFIFYLETLSVQCKFSI